MYNALSSLGAGGLATPWYANATAAAGYGAFMPRIYLACANPDAVFMAFFCVVGGIIVSKIGVKMALTISSTGDIIYAGSLYLNSKNGTQWFLMLGSIISGCTDGLMYSVEGPIITCTSALLCPLGMRAIRGLTFDIIAYPEPDRRGRMLGLWVFMRNAAPVIGGAIIFGLNSSIDATGAVSLKTYLVIIGIMCAGPFISFLLSRPDQVQRRDGVRIVLRKTGWKRTLTEWYRVISNKNVSRNEFALPPFNLVMLA